jgi:hypothetical protein
MMDCYNDEGMVLQDVFTFTGLLEGQFDTLYADDTANKQVIIREKLILGKCEKNNMFDKYAHLKNNNCLTKM